MAQLPEYTPFTGADPKTGDPMAMKGGRTSAIANWVISRAQSLLGSGGRPPGARPMPSIELAVRTPAPQPYSSNLPAIQAPSPFGYQLPNSAQAPMALTTGTPARGMQPAAWSSTIPGSARRIEPWFGPGQPMRPMAPKADVAGRAFDYPSNYNMGSKPRQLAGGVSFDQLRGLADALDLARLAIETRKDQMSALTFSILPRQQAGEQLRGKADDRCRAIEKKLRYPDNKDNWDAWMRKLLEEQFVIDAASIYVRRTNGGDVFSLEIIDGTLIKPLLDTTGRRPDAPQPAYQQELKGMPAVDYTVDELIYAPRNGRVHKAYGFSVIEQIVLTVNIALRRETAKLNYFTEGNIPEAIVSVPKEWQPGQVLEFQKNWDALLKMQADRAGLKFVPGEMTFQPTRSDGMLMGPFDEWLARVICFAFSLPPTAFVQQQNRATAEQAHDAALEEGLAPLMIWFKGVMDRIIQQAYGFDDLEFVFDDVKQLDVEMERAREDGETQQGLLSIDEVRAKRGQDPVGLNVPFIMGVGPMGIMFVDDLIEAWKSGLLKFQPPPPAQQFDEYGNPLPPAPGVGMAPNIGSPSVPGAGPPQIGAPPGQMAIAGPAAVQAPPARPAPPPGPDPLSMIPANILAAVGIGPGGKAVTPITRKEEIKKDPGSAAVGHPQVLHTLRQAEALIASRRK